MRRLQLILAFAAVLFGGALLGVGNMLALPSVPADGAESHHGHHGATTDVAALPAYLTLPAHCLFCIDGVVPQPVQLSTADLAPLQGADRPEPDRHSISLHRSSSAWYTSRAPPSPIV